MLDDNDLIKGNDESIPGISSNREAVRWHSKVLSLSGFSVFSVWQRHGIEARREFLFQSRPQASIFESIFVRLLQEAIKASEISETREIEHDTR